MAAKVLALSCSPRKKGNSELLLDEFLRAAQDNSCQTERIRVAELNIQPCSHCDHCLGEGSCVIQDDMQLLYPKLLEADCLVFASPIYFMAHCAQAKLVIDRCQLFWSLRHSLNRQLISPDRPTRLGVFIATGATHGPKVFAGAKTTMKWFFKTLQIEYHADLLVEACDKIDAVKQHPTALREAYNLGKNLTQILKVNHS